MALPFYYNPATNEFESTIQSLGTRFGLNEISTARNTLSPTKSYTAGLSESFPGTYTSYNDAVSGGFQGTREEWLQQQSIPITERPLTGAAGGRVDMKPGGIVEPGVENYATKKSTHKSAGEGYTSGKGYVPGKGYLDTNRYEYSDYHTTIYDKKLKTYSKKVQHGGSNKFTLLKQKPGETKKEFFKRVSEYGPGQMRKYRAKKVKEIVETRKKIDTWTKNWLDKNLKNYGVKDFDKAMKDLRNNWKEASKNIEVPKGTRLTLSSVVSKLPNVSTVVGAETAISENPFSYEGFEFYKSSETGEEASKYKNQWRKLFYRNKIRTTPGLKKDLKAYFDFINIDKRGMYRQAGGQTIQAYKDILNKDVIYLLSPDAKISGTPKYQLFNSFDKDFNNSFNSYSHKVNKSVKWNKNTNLIEERLGLKKNYIYNSMKQESRNLAKLFDVKQLPQELQYTLEHAQGIGVAAKSGDKEIMKRAVDDLIGTTIKQNQALGWGGFEINRNALMREIVAGRNVKSHIQSLNKLAKDAYTDFGLKGNMYSLKDGKLTSQPISTALTQEERFGQYFKTISKTKEGSVAIKKQYGNLNNLIKAIGCPGRLKTQGGGDVDCFALGKEKIKIGNIKTPGEKANFRKLSKVAGGLKKLGSWLFGPIEMGTLPLWLAGEGLYAQYANKRDLDKALEKMNFPEYQKQLLREGYRQEAVDRGDVGLEDWAIDQPNISGALEKIGYGDKKELMLDAAGAIAAAREMEAEEEAARYEKFYPKAQRERFDRDQPMFAQGGIASLKKK